MKSLCVGCAVKEPWEHRCTGTVYEESYGAGYLRSYPCECEECTKEPEPLPCDGCGKEILYPLPNGLCIDCNTDAIAALDAKLYR